jgi:hypothetical protein
MQNKRGPELKNGVQDGCLVPISKRAKARLKIMSASEKAAVKKAAKLLFDTELMGVKRMREVVRWAEKR